MFFQLEISAEVLFHNCKLKTIIKALMLLLNNVNIKFQYYLSVKGETGFHATIVLELVRV